MYLRIVQKKSINPHIYTDALHTIRFGTMTPKLGGIIVTKENIKNS